MKYSKKIIKLDAQVHLKQVMIFLLTHDLWL